MTLQALGLEMEIYLHVEKDIRVQHHQDSPDTNPINSRDVEQHQPGRLLASGQTSHQKPICIHILPLVQLHIFDNAKEDKIKDLSITTCPFEVIVTCFDLCQQVIYESRCEIEHGYCPSHRCSSQAHDRD